MPQDVLNRLSTLGAAQRMPLTLTFADCHGRIIPDHLDNLDAADFPMMMTPILTTTLLTTLMMTTIFLTLFLFLPPPPIPPPLALSILLHMILQLRLKPQE